jgi:hypothetical protein
MTDERRFDFWQTMSLVGPLAGFAFAWSVAALFGGYEDFQLVDKTPTVAQAFGILGMICFPVGAFFYARRKRNEVLADLSRSWPTVPGTVEACDVETRETRYNTLYAVTARYVYEVAGRSYVGEGIGFRTPLISDKALADRMASKYAPGTKVTVHYDPADPENAVLETSGELGRAAGDWRVAICVGAPFGGALGLVLHELVRGL